jgi:hypothetical protein
MPLTIKLQIGRFRNGNWWCKVDKDIIEHKDLKWIAKRVEKEVERRIELEGLMLDNHQK